MFLIIVASHVMTATLVVFMLKNAVPNFPEHTLGELLFIFYMIFTCILLLILCSMYLFIKKDVPFVQYLIYILVPQFVVFLIFWYVFIRHQNMLVDMFEQLKEPPEPCGKQNVQQVPEEYELLRKLHIFPITAIMSGSISIVFAYNNGSF